MPRYIDADKMIDGYSTTFPYDLSYCDDGDLMEWLNAQPTADVAPIADTINEFADRLIRYYDHIQGGTAGGLVSYHINKIREEMLKKEDG